MLLTRIFFPEYRKIVKHTCYICTVDIIQKSWY